MSQQHDTQFAMDEPSGQASESLGRLQKISFPEMTEVGARYFAWVGPGEKLLNDKSKEPWVPFERGGFVYWFTQYPLVHDDKACMFEIYQHSVSIQL